MTSVPSRDALSGLLQELAQAGYSVGTRQHIQAFDLLAALIAGGAWDVQRFGLMLGPIVSKNPFEQSDFTERFQRWSCEQENVVEEGVVKKIENAEPVIEPAAEGLESQIRAAVAKNRVSAAVVAGLAIILAVLLFFWSIQPGGQPALYNDNPQVQTEPVPHENAPRPAPHAPVGGTEEKVTQSARYALGLSIAGGVLFIILVVSWVMVWWLRGRAFLSRGGDEAGPPDVTQFYVDTGRFSLIGGRTAERVNRALRRRLSVPSPDLQVIETMNRMLQRGGWFEPVYGTRLVTPEYLVLIDRRWIGDQSSVLSDSIVSTLLPGTLADKKYYFDGSPDILQNGRDSRDAVLLREVASTCSAYRLVIVTDAALLARGALSDVLEWCDWFTPWSERYLLTLASFEAVTPQADLLRERFSVFSPTNADMVEWARVLEGERARPQGDQNTRILPETLCGSPERWLQREPPWDCNIEELLLSLRMYLGDRGMQWLSACAGYPELHPPLTLYLGRTLRGADGLPLMDAETLLAMNRLPWFREAWMPEWLRRSLIGNLTPDQEAGVQAVLQDLLLSAVRGQKAGLELEVARQNGTVLSRLLRPMLSRFRKTSDPGTVWKDRVFVSLLSGRTAVTLPEALKNLLSTGTVSGNAVPDSQRHNILRAYLWVSTLLWMVPPSVGLLVILDIPDLNVRELQWLLWTIPPINSILLLTLAWKRRNPWMLAMAILSSSQPYLGLLLAVSTVLSKAAAITLGIILCGTFAFLSRTAVASVQYRPKRFGSAGPGRWALRGTDLSIAHSALGVAVCLLFLADPQFLSETSDTHRGVFFAVYLPIPLFLQLLMVSAMRMRFRWLLWLGIMNSYWSALFLAAMSPIYIFGLVLGGVFGLLGTYYENAVFLGSWASVGGLATWFAWLVRKKLRERYLSSMVRAAARL